MPKISTSEEFRKALSSLSLAQQRQVVFTPVLADSVNQHPREFARLLEQQSLQRANPNDLSIRLSFAGSGRDCYVSAHSDAGNELLDQLKQNL